MLEEAEEPEQEESQSSPTFIRMYGEFWNPDIVNWEKTRRLMGKKHSKSRETINVYDQRGVYVLYKEFQAVYVGKAYRESIGSRLQQHRQSPRKGPRWDQFSWFGIGELTTGQNVNSAADPEALIATLEALLIATIDPRLNLRKEKFKSAVRLYQSDEDKPKDTDVRLQDIEEKLDQLLKNRIPK